MTDTEDPPKPRQHLPLPEYEQHDGLGLAALIKSGQISATELLQAAAARIEAADPALNAVIRKRWDRAAKELAQINLQAPFAGVPFLVKDLLCTLADEPTGFGNARLASLPMPHDSELVRRFKAAGLLIVGRTNTPEFGLTPTTEPLAFGPSHNPWSLAHSPGGSSGGSAAAVAAGMVPLASGGDGGGSIRIPASCCGLFGFKPSRGATPSGPDNGELWRGFAIEHVITRSVRDSAAMLDATAGTDPGSPYAAPLWPQTMMQALDREPGPLRIAFSAKPLFGHAPVHEDCRQAMQHAARLLEQLGHQIEEISPPINADRCAVDFVTVLAGETWATLVQAGDLIRPGSKPHRADFEPATFSLGLLGRSLSAADHAAASQRLQQAARVMAPFFAKYPVLLTPTLATPPALTGSLQPTAAELRLMQVVNSLGAGWLLKASGAAELLAAKTFAYMPYTALFNATGQPAMSVPLYWNAQGLPIGVQLAAAFGCDDLLFSLAGQLERAQPWMERRPPGF